ATRRCRAPGICQPACRARILEAMKTKRAIACILCAMAVPSAPAFAQMPATGPQISERVKKLTRAVQWKQVAAIPVNFNTFHPQGMVRIGDALYVSSVDIRTPTKRFPQPIEGFDRDTGAGVGHLFKMDLKGN